MPTRRTTILTGVLTAACVTGAGFTALAQDDGQPSLAQITTLSDATAALPTNALSFGKDNVFQRDLRHAPIDANSGAMVADLNQQVTSSSGGMAVVNSDQYANARVTAAPDTPRANLTWNNCQGKPAGDFAQIKDAMTNVPIPDTATVSKGTDKELSVYDPASKKLWEFWGADKTASGQWSACWGGVMDASQSKGQFPGNTGVSASGLAMAGMSPTLNEMATGVKQQLAGTADPNNPAINHAMYLALKNPAPWNKHVWPAVRSDGSPNGGLIPEGARLRLKPGTNTSQLSPLAKEFADAAKIYGFVVADKAGAVNVSVQTADTDDTSPVIKNAFSVLNQGQDPWHTLAGFPWDQLEVVDTHDTGQATPMLQQTPSAPGSARATAYGTSDAGQAGASSTTPAAPDCTATSSPAASTSDAGQTGTSSTSPTTPDPASSSTSGPTTSDDSTSTGPSTSTPTATGCVPPSSSNSASSTSTPGVTGSGTTTTSPDNPASPTTGASDSGASSTDNPLKTPTGFYHPYAWTLEDYADRENAADAAALRRLAQKQTTRWLTGSDQDLAQLTQMTTGGVKDRGAQATGAMPSVVLYNIPNRDCGLYSAGGAANADAYRRWVDEVSKAIGDSKIAVTVEPDALHVVNCLSDDQKNERFSLIHYATDKLKANNPNAVVYLAAGDAGDVTVMADRLKQAGIANTRGLALNVAGYQRTDSQIAYGKQLDAALGSPYHFIIDTSRNGSGPPAETGEGAWCNPPGRTVGSEPTTDTSDGQVDAYLWIKDQSSDGACSNSHPVSDPAQISVALAKNSGY